MDRKTALITGASRGIGRAIAVKLYKEGYSLFLAGRDRKALEETERQAKSALSGKDKGKISLCTEDLADPGSPGRIFLAFEKEFGRLDLLVNNAGIVSSGAIGTYSMDEWDRVMAVNARAPFFLMQLSIPLLEKADSGKIINIGSVVSKKGYENQALYASSKHALLGMTKSAARDLSPKNIRVHAVLPGGVATDLVKAVRPDIDTSEMIRPEEIADTVYFLAAMKGNAVIDEISLRRETKTPWD